MAVIGCDMPRWLLLFPYLVLLAVSASYWLGGCGWSVSGTLPNGCHD